MLKLGKMYTPHGEYNIFILKNNSIDRLEIGSPTSKWHCIDSNILYGEYTRKIFKTYGNSDLGKLYKNTIKNSKTIDVQEQMNMRWEDGIFYKDFFKSLPTGEYYGFTEKEGKLDSEVCMYGGVKIVHCVSEITCNLDLEPLNFLQYKRSKKLDDIPVLSCPKAYDSGYENCLFMTEIFRTFFKGYTNSDIDVDSAEELRNLLYDNCGFPVLIRENGGPVSVGTDAIRRLARMKRETPASIITSDIKDNNGRLALTASRLNSAKYPAAVFLEKYRHYKELAEMYCSLNLTRRGAYGTNG